MLESQTDLENMLIVVCPLGLDRIDVAVSRQGLNLDDDEEKFAHSIVGIVTSSSKVLGTVTIGQVFPGGANEFRTALKKYAIEVGFEFKYVKNDGARITTECANKEICQWRVHASVESTNGYFYIRKLCNEHNCRVVITKSSNQRVSSDLVAQAIVGKVRGAESSTKPKDVMDFFNEYCGIKISYFHAWSGVEKAKSEVNGDFSLSFDQLRWYCGIAEETNPGSYFDLQYDPTKNTENKLEMSYNKTRTWNIRPSTEYLHEVNSDPSVTVDHEKRT
ncbi:hypothetical protein Vadar_019027 [Vaccinium darrowii]|uniref:Uncharacterized protein n=1 Tax=Vaccinium darrowii TaxID=229202 RepID=A0ACB7ZKB9_9ERIC|nr:hypothetical protein Vadar_019027 [Vaccinium darrowii]